MSEFLKNETAGDPIGVMARIPQEQQTDSVVL